MKAANKTIIVVTGGNRGIGFEICRQLATRGARIVPTARKPEAGLWKGFAVRDGNLVTGQQSQSGMETAEVLAAALGD